MTNPIISTKFYRPIIAVDYIERKSLCSVLDNTKYNAFTLISAPAGYGKSMLVSYWLVKTKSLYTWISLDKSDNHLHQFLTYLFVGITREIAMPLPDFEAIIQATELPSVENIAEVLLKELDLINNTFFLVLDDYHYIHNQQIHDLLSLIIRFPSQNMNLILISRKDPPIDYNHLRAYGRMNEIRAEELSFSKEETNLFVSNNLGKNNKESLSVLFAESEGWITALRMLLLLIDSGQDQEMQLQGFKKQGLSVLDYLFLEVLDSIDKKYESIILKLSLLNRFNNDLIDVLLKNDRNQEDLGGGQGVIDYLIKTNLFIIQLDNKHEWFRFHHLFQDELKLVFHRKENLNEINKYLIEVSKWFQSKGLINEALDYALRGNKVKRAVKIIEDARITFLDNDNFFVLKQWLDKLPRKEVSNSPVLLLTECWLDYYAFRFDSVSKKLNRLKSLESQSNYKNLINAEMLFFQVWTNYWQGNSREALSLIEECLSLIPKDTNFELFKGDAYIYYALCLHEIKRTKYAKEFISNKISEHPTQSGMLFSRLCASYSFVGLVDIDFEIVDNIRSVWRRDAETRNNLYLQNWVDFCNGLMAFQKLDFQIAKPIFEKISNNMFAAHLGQVTSSVVGQAIIYGIENNVKQANSLLTEFEQFVLETENSISNEIAKSGKARLAILTGNKAEVSKWINSFNPNSFSPALWAWLEAPIITYCKALIFVGSEVFMKKSQKLVNELICQQENLNNKFQLVELYLLAGIIHHYFGNIKASTIAIEKAIEFASKVNFYRPFLELSRFLFNIKDLKFSTNSSLFFWQKMQNIFSNYSYLHQNFNEQEINNNIFNKRDINSFSNNSSQASLIESLTNRELEVLKLLAKGIRNIEIADILFLSEGTVKKHVYNITHKLGTKNRLSCVRKAEALKII